ncbi:MAG: hypothetical protein V4592_16080 [Bacteroidota bacterium]
MKTKNKIILSLAIFMLCLNMPYLSMAQKLPSTQKNGKRAPGSVVIDGDITEWQNGFEAYNVGSRIYYELANDDDNLYLVLRTDDDYGNKKAIYGISLTIAIPVEKGAKSTENLVITFPPPTNAKYTNPMVELHDKIRSTRNDGDKGFKEKIDSMMLVANKQMRKTFTRIIVTGIKEIKSPSIPLDSAGCIKASAKYDKMHFVYELAIPLKYLGNGINEGDKFKYNIRMDGIPAVSPGSGIHTAIIVGASIMEAEGADGAYVHYPTDLSGTYVLVKK